MSTTINEIEYILIDSKYNIFPAPYFEVKQVKEVFVIVLDDMLRTKQAAMEELMKINNAVRTAKIQGNSLFKLEKAKKIAEENLEAAEIKVKAFINLLDDFENPPSGLNIKKLQQKVTKKRQKEIEELSPLWKHHAFKYLQAHPDLIF